MTTTLAKRVLLILAHLIIVLFIAYWGIVYSLHSTPEKVQHLFDPTNSPFLSIPFGNGVVLFTLGQSAGSQGTFRAFYLKWGIWGWK